MYDREITTARDLRQTVQRICGIPSVMGLRHLLSARGIPGITVVPSRPFLDLQNVDHLRNLMCPEGFVALREGLLTIQDVIDEGDLAYMACVEGNNALREGLLTVPQASKLARSSAGTAFSLYKIDSWGGPAALREGWLTIQQMIELADTENGVCALLTLLTDNQGKTAIQEGLLTIQQVVRVAEVPLRLMFLLCDNGITALREGLFTPQQIIGIPDVEQLHKLLSNEGIEARRKALLSQTDTCGRRNRKRSRSTSP
jgi:hypothetical protein